MISLLLAAAVTFDCTNRIIDIQNDGKIFNYHYLGEEKKELVVDGKNYHCIKDYPQDSGPGIRTFSRQRCGPLTLFSQVYKRKCTYDDYNPPPLGFDNIENGKRLLNVQHQCIKTGLHLIGFWDKLRDKNGVEWELDEVEYGYLSGNRAICSNEKKVDVKKWSYKIKKTGDIIEYSEYSIYPIKSIKEEPRPAF